MTEIDLPRAGRPSVRRFLACDGLALALETRGSGSRRLLFAHGFGHAGQLFAEVAAALDPALHTAARLDGRGTGRSDRSSRGYDRHGFAADLRTALEAADGPTDLVAHGLAAGPALAVARRPPPGLARLVLVAPLAELGEAERGLGAAAHGSRVAIARELRRHVPDLRPDVVDRVVDDAVAIDRGAWLAWLGTVCEPGDPPAVPTLVVRAGRDSLAPARPDPFARFVPGAETVELAAGHLLPLERPCELAALLARRFALSARAGCGRDRSGD